MYVNQNLGEASTILRKAARKELLLRARGVYTPIEIVELRSYDYPVGSWPIFNTNTVGL